MVCFPQIALTKARYEMIFPRHPGLAPQKRAPKRRLETAERVSDATRLPQQALEGHMAMDIHRSIPKNIYNIAFLMGMDIHLLAMQLC